MKHNSHGRLPQGNFHRRSIRLHGFDYSQPGAYFVTVCTANRACIFGEVVEGEMKRNQFGEIVLKCWDNLPNYYPPVEPGEFVVMPNHLHGIIVIRAVGARSSRPAGQPEVATTPRRTLGQVVGYLKHRITKEVNQLRVSGPAVVFQRNYYERIIRNPREWNAIARYICGNPANWSLDFDNPVNLKRPQESIDDYWRDAGL